MPAAPHSLLDSLCDEAVTQRIDPHDMMGLVLKFPAQCRQAADITPASGAPLREPKEIRQVVLTGLGGSAIGGDFARCLMEESGSVPMIVNRDYSLPHWVGPHTLVIAASYSGNTEETLNAYAEAKAAGAQQAAITSGGKLRALAEQDGVPIGIVPGGQPPRSATGYMFFPLMNLLISRGVLNGSLLENVEETLGALQVIAKRLGPGIPVSDNPAKQMAIALHCSIGTVASRLSRGHKLLAERLKGINE